LRRGFMGAPWNKGTEDDLTVRLKRRSNGGKLSRHLAFSSLREIPHTPGEGRLVE